MVSEHDEDEEHPQPSGGNGEQVDRDQAPDMVREERAPRLRGSSGRFGIRRETVRSATSMPSFRSSPWIRGAPRSELAWAILRTRAMISALTDRRPTGRLPESLAQCLRTRRRCQCTTGVGSREHEGLPPPGPDLGQANTEQAIPPCAAWAGLPFACTRRRDDVRRGSRGRADVAAAEEREETKQLEQEGDHLS
jgi:hypothetical protein